MTDLFIYGFTSNADAVDFSILGKGIDIWLIYTLIFFAFTSIAFVGTWLWGLIFNEITDKPLE